MRQFLPALGLTVGLLAQVPDHAPDVLVVGVKPGADRGNVNAALKSAGATFHHDIPQLNVWVLRIPESASAGIMAALAARTDLFNYVERDPVGKVQAVVPNDPSLASEPWTLKEKFQSADGAGAWDISTGSAATVIGVVDSGIDGTHPDLAAKVLAGWDFLNNVATAAGANSDSGCKHGTPVSGLIGAATNNAIGIAGGAWQATLMPLVIVTASCTGTIDVTWTNVAAACTYAADHGVSVLNMSIWGTADSNTLELGLKYAYDHNIPIIAAAGNNSNAVCGWPSCSAYVAASVGSVDNNDVLSSFSNYGVTATVYAAGSSQYTTQVGGTYGSWYGTSMSTPEVAAAVALMRTIAPTLTPTQIKSMIAANSDTIPAGLRLNARKLLVAASPGDTTSPTVSIAAPLPGATVVGNVAVTGTAADNVGVTNVEFYVDNVLNTSNPPPAFNFSWDSTSVVNGTHSLMVKAYDAAGNSGSATVSVTVNNVVSSQLLFHADASEVSGGVVTPAVAPSGFTGTVVLNGTGSVNYTPAQTGNGVYFLTCCTNTNRAYYKFTGTTIGTIFHVTPGTMTFYLKSRYSWAQRQASAAAPRYTFDVRDGAGTHVFQFLTQVTSGFLYFNYKLAGVAAYTWLAHGTEDTMFGNGVVLKVTLTWDGTNIKCFLNDTLVRTTPQTAFTPSWTSASIFDLGAYEYQTFGGYNVSDDVIDEFSVN